MEKKKKKDYLAVFLKMTRMHKPEFPDKMILSLRIMSLFDLTFL